MRMKINFKQLTQSHIYSILYVSQSLFALWLRNLDYLMDDMASVLKAYLLLQGSYYLFGRYIEGRQLLHFPSCQFHLCFLVKRDLSINHYLYGYNIDMNYCL